MKSIRKQQPVVVFLFLLTSTAGQGGERSLAFLHSGCSLSSPCQGPGPGVGSPLHGRAACVGSAMALFVVASSSFMCPEIRSCILVYICPSGFLLCPVYRTLLIPKIFKSSLCECFLHCTNVWNIMGGSADPEQGQFTCFLWSFSGRVGKLSWIHVNRQTKANTLTFC